MIARFIDGQALMMVRGDMTRIFSLMPPPNSLLGRGDFPVPSAGIGL
jgi:hypothetical protein